MTGVIYGLADADGAIRYVGRTIQSPKSRLKIHRHRARSAMQKLPVHEWMAAVAAAGREVQMCILAQVPCDQDIAVQETEWIQKLSAAGAALLNQPHGHGNGRPTPRIGCTCSHCGNEFTRSAARVAQGYNKFCTRRCKQAAQIGISKPTSPQFREAGKRATAARVAAQTHCKRGHLLAGENLIPDASGARRCRECQRARDRSRQAEMRRMNEAHGSLRHATVDVVRLELGQ